MLKKITGFCLVAFIMMSCGSTKKIAYLQDAVADEISMINTYTNVVKPGDMLSIVVSSSKPELAVPFNLYSVKNQMSSLDLNSGQNQQLEGYTVSPNGDIDFPSLGTLRISGMTRNELADMLKQKLEAYIPAPIVTINFLNFKITVIGEVKKPGNFDVNGDRISIFEALGLAGDLTEYGSRKNVLVIRETGGVREIGRLDLKSKSIFDSPFYYLQQNDVVCVEPIKTRSFETSPFKMNLPLIASLGSFASSLAMLIFYITNVTK